MTFRGTVQVYKVDAALTHFTIKAVIIDICLPSNYCSSSLYSSFLQLRCNFCVIIICNFKFSSHFGSHWCLFVYSFIYSYIYLFSKIFICNWNQICFVSSHYWPTFFFLLLNLYHCLFIYLFWRWDVLQFLILLAYSKQWKWYYIL
jgi:hypothetical protein